jgi:hypothetical protein
MHTPDLSLASSYIPACLCLLKCTFVFILFLFAPLRGWIGICSLLVTDRILWNRLNPILDVNAVAFALAGGLAITRMREHVVDSMFHWVVILPWGVLTGLQIIGATRLNKSTEVIAAAMAVSILSCMHQDTEPPMILALRAFAFSVGNTVLAYLSIVLMDDYSDTYIHVSRTLVLLLGEWRVSLGWLACYFFCMGHQIRSKHCIPEPQHLSSVCVKECAAYPDIVCDNPTPSKLLAPAQPVDETGLLREALARKGKMSTH